VQTALEMRDRILDVAETMDIVVMAAAVADHRPAAPAQDKIHCPGEPYTLTLEPNPDILAELCARRRPGQVIVGFAAEVGADPAAAEVKLRRKGCDLLVANDVSAPGAEFGSDTNIVTLFAPGATPEALPRLAKRELAERIWDRIEILRARPRGA
jgi:phosphopantothenoylcysteine decarboxylase/phosphopantothenate--cysteine ligase